MSHETFAEPSRQPFHAPSVTKRSVVVHGHKTSVSLEDSVWANFRQIAVRRGQTIASLLALIDAQRRGTTRSRAIRQFVDEQARAEALGQIMIGAELPSQSHANPE